MTRLLLILLVACVAACNTPSNEPAKAVEETPAPAKHDYGVKFNYSSDIGLGDVALADKVVSLWKQFDANTLDSTRSMFADSVETDMPGLKGKFAADSLLSMVKSERGKLSSCVSEFDGIIPMKVNDRGDNVVSVWGVETTTSGGKTMKRDLNEVWGFNKDGKVDFIKQYELKR